jgi:hypothetical protein
MNKSENIGALAKAFSGLLGEIQDPIKNKAAHTARYADLPQILGIARPLLSKYGLAISQFPGKASPGKVCIETILMHESGEWISSEYEMDSIDPSEIARLKSVTPAQATGIIITYARRYSLTALLGICAQEDTDGNVSNSNKKLTGQEIAALFKACNNNKEKIEGVMKWAKVSNINELTLDQYIEALEIIKKQNGVK